jgi:hypothetical protein
MPPSITKLAPGDEAGALAVQAPARKFVDIFRPADAAGRMLLVILGFDPAGIDAWRLWRCFVIAFWLFCPT